MKNDSWQRQQERLSINFLRYGIYAAGIWTTGNKRSHVNVQIVLAGEILVQVLLGNILLPTDLAGSSVKHQSHLQSHHTSFLWFLFLLTRCFWRGSSGNTERKSWWFLRAVNDTSQYGYKWSPSSEGICHSVPVSGIPTEGTKATFCRSLSFCVTQPLPLAPKAIHSSKPPSQPSNATGMPLVPVAREHSLHLLLADLPQVSDECSRKQDAGLDLAFQHGSSEAEGI